MHDTRGGSELSDSDMDVVAAFKHAHRRRLQWLYELFDREVQKLTKGQAVQITDAVQRQLLAVCEERGATRAVLMLYLVERRGIKIVAILQPIKRENFCLAVALRRRESLASA